MNKRKNMHDQLSNAVVVDANLCLKSKEIALTIDNCVGENQVILDIHSMNWSE